MINITSRPVFFGLACAVLIALTTLSGRGIAEERWVEGQHYQTLTPPRCHRSLARCGGDRVLLVRLWTLLHL